VCISPDSKVIRIENIKIEIANKNSGRRVMGEEVKKRESTRTWFFLCISFIVNWPHWGNEYF
jgi:hypothetical protein